MEIIIAFIGGMLLSAVGLGIFEAWIKKLVRSIDTEDPWHDGNESPENKTHVLAFKDGRYVVMFYRDAMYEDKYDYYLVNRVDRWMYIPGNTISRKE